MSRKASFAALLGVVAISIVFGMVVGGKLNAPQVMHAARETAGAGVFPAASGSAPGIAGPPDFSLIADNTLPAVVGVQNTSVHKEGEGDTGDQDQNAGPDDPMFRFFFGPPTTPNNPHGRGRIGPRQPERRVSSGSGFIITDDGYILTNNHVVQGATKLQVTLDTGEKFDAKVIGCDPMIDLGLIKIDPKGKKLPTLPLGDSDTLKIGNWVMAVGNPLSLERTVTVGVVSGKKRQVPIGETIPGLANFIQTDAAINFGNSGGPLLDGQGRVVGINTAIFRGEMAEGIGFAIPINEARKAAEELRADGEVKRGYLGISMSQSAINEAVRSYYKLPDAGGVFVSHVAPKGPADRAGVKKNDIIRKTDGQPVKDNQDLQSRVAAHKPGETIRLDLYRDGKPMSLDVKLGTRPLHFDEEGDEEAASPDEPGDEGGDTGAGIGIKVRAVPPLLRQSLGMGPDDPGVVIESVDPDSDAAEQGLTPQTAIVSVNDVPVKSVADFNRVTKGLKPGDTAKVEYKIGKNRTDSVFVVVPRPSSK